MTAPLVAAAFEVQLAELRALGRVTTIPEPPLQWGSDLSCVTDCTAAFDELFATSPRIVAQAVARRFLTPRNGLIDDPHYGLDLRSYCNRGTTQQDLRTLQSRCVAEARKDERVATADVNIVLAIPVLAVTVTVTPEDPTLERFTFVLSVDSETTLLELI